jgi:hypothetical protein
MALLWSCQVGVERKEHHTGKTEKMHYRVLLESMKQISVGRCTELCNMKEVTRSDHNTHLHWQCSRNQALCSVQWYVYTTDLNAPFRPICLHHSTHLYRKYLTAAIHKKSKIPVPQHILGYHLASYHHEKPTSKYAWNFIQMQLHQPTHRHLHHDLNAFNIYRSMKSTGVNQTTEVQQNTNLTPQHQAKTATSTIL